ncbi:MAG TPA: ABC transporter substrate-binding protein [Candidatus Binatia bacterium]|nr:ABC transporter substrate-binding protein [Candidatus Binatia bacterium]
MKAKITFQLLATILLAIVSAAEAQQPAGKVPRIGILTSGSASDPRVIAHLDTLRSGLREIGYVEGKSIVFESRYAEGKIDRRAELADKLVRLKVDILFGFDSGTAQAAKKSSTTIPVVFTGGGNPVTSGLVASLARPGGNVTGVTTNSPELVGKPLGLLKEAVPKVSRFAFLMPAESANMKKAFDDAKGTAKALGIQFQAVEVKTANPDLEGAFRLMAKERIGGLVTEGPPRIAFHRKRIFELANKNRLPAIHAEQEWANDGGLMSYGANRNEPYRRAAVFVDKILKGAKPADLPVEQPTKFEFVINLKAAKLIGVTIPQSVLFRADKVIR